MPDIKRYGSGPPSIPSGGGTNWSGVGNFLTGALGGWERAKEKKRKKAEERQAKIELLKEQLKYKKQAASLAERRFKLDLQKQQFAEGEAQERSLQEKENRAFKQQAQDLARDTLESGEDEFDRNFFHKLDQYDLDKQKQREVERGGESRRGLLKAQTGKAEEDIEASKAKTSLAEKKHKLALNSMLYQAFNNPDVLSEEDRKKAVQNPDFLEALGPLGILATLQAETDKPPPLNALRISLMRTGLVMLNDENKDIFRINESPYRTDYAYSEGKEVKNQTFVRPLSTLEERQRWESIRKEQEVEAGKLTLKALQGEEGEGEEDTYEMGGFKRVIKEKEVPSTLTDSVITRATTLMASGAVPFFSHFGSGGRPADNPGELYDAFVAYGITPELYRQRKQYQNFVQVTIRAMKRMGVKNFKPYPKLYKLIKKKGEKSAK